MESVETEQRGKALVRRTKYEKHLGLQGTTVHETASDLLELPGKGLEVGLQFKVLLQNFIDKCILVENLERFPVCGPAYDMFKSLVSSFGQHLMKLSRKAHKRSQRG